jgi:RimJ/RimL family protein N-acetyltransferase
MWVAPEARGRGALRVLCEAAVAWTRARGLHTLELGVMDTNAGARAAYAAAGFAEQDRQEVRRGGRDLVHVRMTRPVS